MTTRVAPSSEHSTSTDVPLECICNHKPAVDNHQGVTQAQDQKGSNTLLLIDCSQPSTRNPGLKDHTKKRMPFQRLKSSRKSGTVLRAVPETTACKPALLADERDMSTSTYQAKSCKSASSSPALSSISENEVPQGCTQHNTSPTTNDSNLKSTTSIASLRGAIGTYKHGKIQWRLKDRQGLSVVKSLKPKIHVVIPTGAQDRNQPTAPISGHPNNAQVRSASAEIEDAYDISPPTGSNRVMMRDSIVSPLHHPPSVPSRQFQLSKPTTPTNQKCAHHRKNNSASTTSSVDSRQSDEFSLHSNRSSETSVEEDSSRTVPVAMDDHTITSADYGPPPAIPPRRYAPCTAKQDGNFQSTCTLQPTRCATNGITRRPTVIRRTSNTSGQRKSLASRPVKGAINQALKRSESKKSDHKRSISPTLSEAENELERSLTSFTEDTFLERLADNDKQSQTLHDESGRPSWKKHMTRPSAEPAPLLPRKSSKRQSVINADLFRLSRIPNDHIASQITRGRSLRRDSHRVNQRSTAGLVLSPLPLSATLEPRTIPPKDAENILHKILQSVDHLEDLLSAALVNNGFYQVFKRHELDLIKSVIFKNSPPAWEFREIAFPGHDLLRDEDLEMTRPFEEYSPTSYIHLYNRDVQTLRDIKSLIKEKCHSFVRSDISDALVDEASPNAGRVNDALWRIWAFCKIFGSGKGREEDAVAQQDWLKGGVQAHQPACTFNVMGTDFMNDTLISAPDCFAKGNEGGLTAEQLFDMMELWNCLGVLLQGFQSHTAEARKFGIYDDTEIRGGDIDGEEMMLDEWCHHLLSLGLATVLDLARLCYKDNGSAFALAHENNWTSWKPPLRGSSKRSFLKEAASRVYEDKLANVYAESSTRELQRQMSKQRIQKHIHDLRHRKNNGEQLRMIRQSQDRPMSEWENVMRSLTRQHPPLPATNNLTSHIPSFRPTSAIAQEISTNIAELPAVPPATRISLPPIITQTPLQRTVAQPLLPTPPSSTISGAHDRSSIATTMPPIVEHSAFRMQEPISRVPFPDHPAFRAQRPQTVRRETNVSISSRDSTSGEHSTPISHYPVFQQHPVQADIFDSPSYENTAEKAIYRIVEMGFTADLAREALRVTDLGDGLRVDCAVEFLLSRQT